MAGLVDSQAAAQQGVVQGEVLTSLLRRFPDLQITDSPGTLRWRHTRLLRSLESLQVRW